MIIDKAGTGENIVFYGENDTLRNYLFLDYFSEIIDRVIRKKIYGTFNCLFPKSFNLSEIAETAYNVFEKTGSIHFLKDEADIPDIPVTKDSELYEKIGFEPAINIKKGIHLIKNNRALV